jgi:release factor glutamine methyltransferase
MNLKDLIIFSKKYLEDQNIENAKYSAETIIANILGCKRLDIYLSVDQNISEDQFSKISFLLKKRAKGEPLEYIFNSAQFYESVFFVNSDVLIPRIETEYLVELISKEIRKDDLTEKSLWDIATGSGCIAISLKKSFPLLKVIASDVSNEALLVAKKNAKKSSCDINFKLGDLLDPFIGEKADYVVCNPPYISEEEYLSLSVDVKNFEPKKALVAKDNGLEFYKKLEEQLPSFLASHGKVFFEIGYTQANDIKKIFSDKRWVFKKIYKDLSDKDRFFFLEIE